MWSFLGGFGFGGGGDRLGGPFGPGMFGPGMPGPYEGLEGAKVQAVGSIDAPLNAEKGIESVRVGVAEGREW
jgi:hypothetical protein